MKTLLPYFQDNLQKWGGELQKSTFEMQK